MVFWQLLKSVFSFYAFMFFMVLCLWFFMVLVEKVCWQWIIFSVSISGYITVSLSRTESRAQLGNICIYARGEIWIQNPQSQSWWQAFYPCTTMETAFLVITRNGCKYLLSELICIITSIFNVMDILHNGYLIY